MTTNLTRRELVAGVGTVVGLTAIGGAIKVAYPESSLLRPPGGQWDGFAGACLRCDRCRTACPNSCIDFATVEDGLFEMRLPKMNFHRGYCDFCEEANDGVPLCREVCPTQALHIFDPATEKIGLAVIDTATCIAWVRGGCDKCFDSCDYEALILQSGCPVIVADKCNGCGACVKDCTANVYRSYNGSQLRAVEVEKYTKEGE